MQDNQEVPERLQIQDFDEYLRNNGLGNGAEQESQPSESNRDAEASVFEEQSRYQASIHEAIFSEGEAEESLEQEKRQKLIDSWSHVLIEVATASCIIPEIPLKPLAESCDTVFALGSTWNHFASSDSSDEKMQLSLEQFHTQSVREFLGLVMGNRRMEEIPADAVVDCCQIAHYLQNSTILEETVAILTHSIDTENCMSICQLADQLNLPTLFESALSYMMKSLGDMETNDAWEDLSGELKERIGIIQKAIQSSIHSQRSRLYFSSLDEYLAIFAETVQYNRERLAEAKESHSQSTSTGHAWMDTQTKIERQERRVRTLEAVMKEQKKLFSKREADVNNNS
jgi:hypothetical protein